MRYEADRCENFVDIVRCDVLAQRPIRLSNAGSVPPRGQVRSRAGCPGKEDDARGRAAQSMDGISVGGLLLHQAQERIFEETAAGQCREPAGFIDGQQMCVFEERFEAPRNG